MPFDPYETELLNHVAQAESLEQSDRLEDELEEAREAAQNYLTKTRNINIRLSEYDLFCLKRKSAENNIPYQTILASVIHQYVTGKIKPRL